MFLASRPLFITASVMPVLVAGAYVKWHDGQVSYYWWLVTLLAMMFLHSAGNLFNDYFDHLSGADALNVSFVSPFTGGGRFLQRGLVSPRQVLLAAFACLLVGSALGLYLTAAKGLLVLGLGLFGVLTLFFYTAPPLQLSYRGLGELVIGLNFGVLPMLGTQYVLTGRYTFPMLLLSLPLAAFVMGIILINEFPDAASDALAGKRHWVVLWGGRRAALVLLAIYALAFLVIGALVAVLWLPLAALVSLVTVLVVGKAAALLYQSPEHPAVWRRACPAGVTGHLLLGLLLCAALLLSAPPTLPPTS
jgi:1,4-dihydroxy-2-naphthoate octaprenyltransferase